MTTSVIGLQWGDEAKGKIVDLLTPRHHVVVRYLGGNNAGHTVKFDGATYKLSLLPAGILHDTVTSVIATGVVINPKAFLEELESITGQRGAVPVERLKISNRSHIIFPYHMAQEAAFEKARGGEAIGTTMRGIGLCYRDKAGRTHAIRMCDLIRPDVLKRRLEEILPQKNAAISAIDPDFEPLHVDDIFEEFSEYADQLRPYVTDTTSFLHAAVRDGKRLLFEG
ncbi:MAG: adenylosuccinate synthase, partial [Fuerstiella sp.]|nr:adenylosuccinate synthase [Fuerstiella sp.]